MWRIIFFLSLGYNVDCKAEHSSKFDKKSLSSIEETFIHVEARPLAEYFADGSPMRNSPVAVESILQAASNVVNSQNIDEMIKRIEIFSRKFPAELLKEKSLKPLAGKLKGDFKQLTVKAKPILEMARKLEKMGKHKSKKQVDEFNLKISQLKTHFESFTKSVNAETQKQRNKNLKIMKNNQHNVHVLEDAKRCINMVDLVSETIQLLQSIPGKISCLIFGNCEVDHGSDIEDEEESSDDGDDESDDLDEN